MDLQGVDDGGGGVVDEADARSAIIRPDACHHYVDILQTFLRCCSVTWYTFDDVRLEGGRALKIWKCLAEFGS